MKRLVLLVLALCLFVAPVASATDIVQFTDALTYRAMGAYSNLQPGVSIVTTSMASVHGVLLMYNKETLEVNHVSIPIISFDVEEDAQTKEQRNYIAIAAIAALEHPRPFLDSMYSITGKSPFNNAKELYMNWLIVASGDTSGAFAKGESIPVYEGDEWRYEITPLHNHETNALETIVIMASPVQ